MNYNIYFLVILFFTLSFLSNLFSCKRFSNDPERKDATMLKASGDLTEPLKTSDEKVYNAIEGEWISYGGLAEINFAGGNATFKFEDDLLPFFELNGLSKKIDKINLSFDHDSENYKYYIYWVWDDPNKLILSRKTIATGKYVQEHFIRLEASEYRELE